MGIPEGWLHIDLKEWDANIRELTALRTGLAAFPDESRAAMMRVLNRAGSAVVTEGVNLVFKRYIMKKAYISRTFVQSKATYRRMSTRIWVMGPQAEHLTNWNGTRQTKQGVKVRILRGKGDKIIRSAFIVPGQRSGKKIAFQRAPNSGSRYPISALYTTSGLDILNNRTEQNKIFMAARSRMAKTAQSELAYRLEKLAKQGKV